MQKSILYILFVISSLFLFSCRNEDEFYNQMVKEQTEVLPDQVAHNVTIHFYESAKITAILKGKRAEVYYSKNRTDIKDGLEVEYFSKNSGKRLGILTSREGWIDDITKDMFAKGNVVLFVDSSQMRLETNFLAWDAKKELIHTDEYVKITTPTELLEGYGFESDINLTHYKIYKIKGRQL
ncbi:MAG TPA: LPS export ABC transporter periplasmic protein LptC [Bacteroidota bacterium]|nr:LPS export ABC transporter periplasmic protein LptC [Candidatus Kapabacteria bacterium]HRS00997.1 LPS export ABC transporter periplasmic protein LptC [Bacteroidota bacterium]